MNDPQGSFGPKKIKVNRADPATLEKIRRRMNAGISSADQEQLDVEQVGRRPNVEAVRTQHEFFA